MLTRFAPSPTGYLHVGNARTALICWMYTNSKNGKFLLRFDDTDFERSNSKYINDIMQDLKWMGINWDLNFKQSERFDRYNEILLKLIKRGYIYKCYETKKDLDVKRKLQLTMGLPPIYDRSSLFLTKEKRNFYEQKEGRKAHFRFKLDRNKIISWNDEIKGKISIAMNNISDPIVKRENGIYTYMLPSVIDDIDFDITHVIRGEDHIVNTAIQIQITQALKAKIQKFAHLPLLCLSKNRKKISKSNFIMNIKSIKKEIEPIALVNYLVRIGTSDPIGTCINIQNLINSFNIKNFNSASVQFDLNEVYKLNSKILQKMTFEMVKKRLNKIDINCCSDFWYFIRNNIEKFSDVYKWWQICKFNIQKTITVDKKFAKIALNSLPHGDCDENTLSKWIKTIQEKTKNIKIKDLFIQLRLVLTGIKSGPELSKLLIFMGRDNIVARLKNQV